MPLESGLVAGLIFVGWFLWLWQSGRVRRLWPQTTVRIQSPHAIQAVLQLVIYVYWSFYWDEVARRPPYIAGQIVFAYLFEVMLLWSRGKAWRFRLAPLPIVLSMNLFLWFKDEYFAWQLVMLAGAYLGKEFITWERNGRRSHIFNPSAFPLAIAGVLLMATNTIQWTYGLDLTWSFSIPPHFYEVIFLLGLVVQIVFATTWITFGAAVTLVWLYALAERFLGTPMAPQPFDAAVFLGLTLLVPDPVTTPRAPVSKLVFGALYGVFVFAAYVALRMLREPAYFDKILAVPLVNLLTPLCEVIGARIGLGAQRLFRRSLGLGRVGAVAVYAVFFLSIIPGLGALDEGFESPLPPHAIALSPDVQDLSVRLEAFRLTAPPEVFTPFAFAEEWRNYRPLWTYEPRTSDEFVAFGRAFLECGKFDNARTCLQTAVQMDTASADAHLYLGNALLRMRQLPAAVVHLEQSLSLRPDDEKALANLGTAMAMQGRTAEAIVRLQEATALNPLDATALANLGTALLQQGQRNEGLEHLHRAVSLRPANTTARLQLGIALCSEGRDGEGLRHLRRVLFLNPEESRAQQFIAAANAKAAAQGPRQSADRADRGGCHTSNGSTSR